MRLATARDEIEPLRDPSVRRNEAYVTVLLLARVIARIGAVTDVTPQVVEELYAADFDHLQRLYGHQHRWGARRGRVVPGLPARVRGRPEPDPGRPAGEIRGHLRLIFSRGGPVLTTSTGRWTCSSTSSTRTGAGSSSTRRRWRPRKSARHDRRPLARREVARRRLSLVARERRRAGRATGRPAAAGQRRGGDAARTPTGGAGPRGTSARAAAGPGHDRRGGPMAVPRRASRRPPAVPRRSAGGRSLAPFGATTRRSAWPGQAACDAAASRRGRRWRARAPSRTRLRLQMCPNLRRPPRRRHRPTSRSALAGPGPAA